MFKKLDHVEIITDDMEGSLNFYSNVLGLKTKTTQRVEQSILGVPMDIVMLEVGDGCVELISYDGARPGDRPEGENLGIRMMALEVDDMDETLAYLNEHGIEPTWGPRIQEGWYARAEITDPHGNRIELRHWY
jgi:glyoxylase I family protein